MASTAIDSAIFRDIFSSEAMRRVFSDDHRVQCYLDIEAALAHVQAKLVLIPQRAADEIMAKCTLDNIDMARLKSQTELIGYPVLPVVQQLVAACSDRLRRMSLGSNYPGHHRYSHHHADAGGPRSGRAGSGSNRRFPG